MPLPAPTGLVSDVIVPLHAEIVQMSCGLAFDIGSTMGKIIYRSNKEYKDGQLISPKDDSKLGQVHFAMFPRGDVKGMIRYIKENCDLTKNEDGDILVYSSGVGGAAFRTEIENGLNCKFVVVPETDCFCKGFLTLEKILPEEELFIPHSQKVQEEVAKLKAQMEAIVPKILEDDVENTKMPDASEAIIVNEEDKPRMMVVAGSGTGLFQINKDETCTLMSAVYTAGRFMYGLSSVLTGENDFSKLREMADMADGKTADIWLKDLTGDANAAGADNVYEAMAELDMLTFPFGKGVTVKADEMKKEDMVYSVFNTTAIIHAEEINAYARSLNAKAVYFTGNVFNSEIMRNMITYQKHKINITMPQKQQYEYYFLKNGGMFGALGAFLQTKKKTES